MRLVIECSSNIKSLNITFDSGGSSDLESIELLEESGEKEIKPRAKKDRAGKIEKQKVEEVINFSEFMDIKETKETQEIVKPIIKDISDRPAKIADSVTQAF